MILSAMARRDLVAALAWYRAESDALADEFESDFDIALRRIADFPEAWTPFGAGERACRLRRFPYRVIYRRFGLRVVVVAVAHVAREPGYWSASDPPE